MATRKNEYRLDQDSPTGSTGFESFKSSDDQLYYFHYNDEKGQPLLFSTGFSTAKERTSARNTARKLLTSKEAFKKSGHQKAYYFTITSKSGKELVRSRTFTDRKKRDTALTALLEGQSSTSATPKIPKKKAQVATPAPEEVNTQQSVLPSRFRYNLIFRRMEEGQPLVGEIEYPILKERATFQGLDEDAILAFITQHLPQDLELDTSQYKSQKQLEQEIANREDSNQKLQTELEAANARETSLIKAHKAQIAQERDQAKAKEADLLNKLEQAEAHLQGQIQELSSSLEKEQLGAKNREAALRQEMADLRQHGMLLQQELVAAQAQLKQEIAEKEAVRTQFNDLQLQHTAPATIQPGQPTGDRASSSKPANGSINQQSATTEKVQKTVALFADGSRAGTIINLDRIQTASLEMPLQQTTERDALESFKADIYIKSLEDNRRLTLVKNHYGTIGTEGTNVTVPLALHTLSPGIYRFNLSVSSVQPPFNATSPKFEGHTVVQVV